MPILKYCTICKKSFYVQPKRRKTAKFCSRKCKAEFQKTLTGSKSPCFKGGYKTTDYYRVWIGKDRYTPRARIVMENHLGRKLKSSERIYHKDGNKFNDRINNLTIKKVYSRYKIRTTQGYIKILKPDHPKSNKDGYILEHRLVIEKQLNRYLEPYELVHHKNRIKNDNRIENLEVKLKKTHHGKIICPFCKKEFLLQ